MIQHYIVKARIKYANTIIKITNLKCNNTYKIYSEKSGEALQLDVSLFRFFSF